MVYGHKRSAEATNFLNNLATKQGEKQPDKPCIMLPTCLSQKNAYEEYVKEHDKPFCYRHFQRVWKERYPEMKASERTTFTECKECAMIKQLKTQKLTKEQLVVLEKQKKAHLLVARIAREKYYKHAKKAVENKKKYISIIIDNMDQSKTNLPRFPTYHKGDANLTRLHHHVTGVLAHGQKKSYIFTWTDKFGMDCNITINCLLEVLNDISEENSLPPTLYIQADNSAKDNKNFILMGFLANLVQRKIFKKIKLSFLMVGHTHEDVDQMFSRLSVHLSGKSIPTLPVLQSLMKDAYHPIPMIMHLNGLWDYRKLGMASPVSLTGHSSPHIFRFKEDHGKVLMGYKEWPYKAAEYKTVDVTQLAEAYNLDPEQLHLVAEKGSRAFDLMMTDLRKWQAGGKLSDEHISWWKEHLRSEKIMNIPCTPKASSFNPYQVPPEDGDFYSTMTVLGQHVSNLSKESVVRVVKRKTR
ncbi:uncharacterized protein LOC125678464 [Ostrea edulis]|nr:uncharacterized protein LOC125678464 [Ostrea edulis]